MKGTLLLTAGALALRAVGVLFHGWLARTLGPEGMGLLQLIFTLGAFAGTLGSSGSRVAVLQLAAAARGRGDRQALAGVLWGCLGYGLLAGSGTAVLLCILSGPLSLRLLPEPGTAGALKILALFLPCTVVCGILRGFLTACGRLAALTGAELLERLACVGLTVLFLRWAGQELTGVLRGVLLAGGCAGLLQLGLLALPVRRERLPRGVPPDRTVAKTCLPLALNDYLRSGLGAVEQFLIPYGLGKYSSASAGLAAYGIIAAMVFPVITLPEEMLYAMSDLMISELARLKANRELGRLRTLVGKSLACTSGLAAATAAGLYFAGPAMGRLIFHSEQAGRLLRLFSPMVLFRYPDATVDGLQKGLGQQLWLVRYNSLTNVIDVAGLFLLLPRFGIWGYIATYVTSHLVNLFLSLRRLLIALEEA